MKNYVYLLFLFVSLCGCLADNEGSASWTKSWRKDEEYIDRPCSFKDINCIRRVMTQNSHCKPSHGPAPDPLYMKQTVLPLAKSNITFILNDVQLTGLNNGKIIEFYINKKTGNLVIAVEIRKLTFYSPNTVWRYQRRAKEPIVLSDALIVTYGLVTFTATIPNYKYLELSNAEVNTYVDDGNPPYAVGPNVIKSLDSVTIKLFNDFVNNIPENAKEVYIFLGSALMNTYIQSNICNFGLKLVTS